MRRDRPFRNSLLGGIAVLTATVAACALLTVSGWWIPAVFVAVLGGFAMMAVARENAVPTWGGLFLCAAAGFMATSLQTPLFGGTVEGIPVSEASAHPDAAAFRFIDGRILDQASGSLTVHGGNAGRWSPLHELRIAPIIGNDWTPAAPVTAWAVSTGPNSGLPRTDWSRPSRAAVRVVSIEAAGIREAIARTERLYGLRSARNAALLHWLDDPEGAIMSQRLRLLTILGVSAVIWLLLLLIGSLRSTHA